jgi:hypothetical protein
MDDPVKKLFQDFDQWKKQHGLDIFIAEIIYYFNR